MVGQRLPSHLIDLSVGLGLLTSCLFPLSRTLSEGTSCPGEELSSDTPDLEVYEANRAVLPSLPEERFVAASSVPWQLTWYDRVGLTCCTYSNQGIVTRRPLVRGLAAPRLGQGR